MRPQHIITLAVILTSIFVTALASADHITFDGGTVGTIFGQPTGTPAGTLLFTEDGTDIIITTLVSNGSQSYNFCKIEDSFGAPVNFHQNNIMSLQGVGLVFDFDGEGDVRFEYLHTGGDGESSGQWFWYRHRRAKYTGHGRLSGPRHLNECHGERCARRLQRNSHHHRSGSKPPHWRWRTLSG